MTVRIVKTHLSAGSARVMRGLVVVPQVLAGVEMRVAAPAVVVARALHVVLLEPFAAGELHVARITDPVPLRVPVVLVLVDGRVRDVLDQVFR